MSTTLPRLDEPADAELISAVRGGDVDAYGELYRRHVESARRLARQLVGGPDVDDLVSEAFAKVLVVLQRGGGPDLAFRAYLLTAVRRLHVDRFRATARLRPTDDLTPFDPGIPFRDTAVEGFESGAAARAFASLPERWQLVLWHTEVEGQKPAEVAPLLGLSPNSVSALAYRAREGLRQAFLCMHAQDTVDAACRETQGRLGPYVRGGLSRRDARRVEEHVTGCRRCAAVLLELTEINAGLAGLLAPTLLGAAATAYVGSAGGSAATGALLGLLGRARDLLLAHAPASAVAGVAAGSVLVGVAVHSVDRPQASPDARPAGPAASAPARSSQAGDARGQRTGRPGGRHPRAGTAVPAEVLPVADVPTAEAPEPASTTPSLPPQPGGPESPVTQPPVPPGDATTDQPPAPPTGPQPGDVDLAVTAGVSPSAGAAHVVRVTVTGQGPGAAPTLGVDADRPSVSLTPDPRCGGVQVGSGRCTVSGAPATYTFVVGALPDAPTRLTFTVRPGAGTVETDPTDNTTTVLLAP
ncbi:sigma-70 family RNA polymerase sigma factor [Nocardioides sp. MAHUQ-72]|uniref:sigma-70 family RNA polymerase sigma factor n=1 Tax=unclassified Nocardioides TaxID=2615069 RepID=UPI00360E348F